MLGLLWLIPAFPAAGFLALVLLDRRLSRRGAAWIGAGSVGLSALVALLVCGSFIVSPACRRCLSPGPLDLVRRRRLRPDDRPLPRRRERALGARHHRRRLPHPPVLHRAHGARRGLHAVLHVHEPVRRFDADPGAGRQPAAALPGLGGRRTLQLPAHLLLAEGPAERVLRPQGIHRHARGRHGDDRRPLPAVHAAAHAADPAAAGGRREGVGDGVRRRRGRRPAHARRRRRQVRPGSAADVAPGRDGRPIAGQRAHPRRHHGDRRRVPHRAHQRPVHARAGRPPHRGDRRHGDAADRRLQRARAARPQASARLLDHQPDRLHVPGARRLRLGGGRLPLHDARLLQGPALPRRRRDHRGARRRARHLQDGRAPARAARRLLDLHHRRRRPCRPPVRDRRLLQQGSDHLDEPRLRRRERLVLRRRRWSAPS